MVSAIFFFDDRKIDLRFGAGTAPALDRNSAAEPPDNPVIDG